MSRSNYGVNFNGRRIVHPGAYDRTDASGMSITTPGSLNIPIVVGEAESGESGKVMWFTSADRARDQLQGGELVHALELIFSPSSEGGGGASTVGVIVANKTTRATAEVGGFKFSARRYGRVGNNVQIRLEDGDIEGTKRFVESRWGTDYLSVYENVGAALRLEYTGDEAYATVSVIKEGGKATRIETKVGDSEADAQVDISIDLDNSRFHNMEQLLRYFTTVSGYRASYVEQGSAGLASEKLDELQDVSIKGGNFLMSAKGDLVHRVNNESDLLIVEEAIGSVEDVTSQYLSGGTTGDAPSSWAEYYDLIKKEFSDILVVLSDSKTAQAEAVTHVQQMERRHQKQMLFTGGGVNESIEDIKARAADLNSSRAVVGYPSIRSGLVEDGNRILPSYFTGALIAGRVAGVSASEPITFDEFNVITLGRDLVAGDPEIDDLITSGVATLEKVQGGGIRLVQGITTYLGSNNSLFREISVRRGADQLSELVRVNLEKTFVGQKGIPATSSAVMSATIDELEGALRDGEITAYRGVTVRFEGTAIWVSYEVAPIEPINFILVTSHFVPDSNITTEQV